MEPLRLKDLAHSLEYVRRDLANVIAPELRSASAASTLEMICKLLKMLSQEALATPDEGLARRVAHDAVGVIRKAGDLTSRQLADHLGAEASKPGEDAQLLVELLEQSAMEIAGERAYELWPTLDALAGWREARDSGSSQSAWETSYQESSGSRAAALKKTAGPVLTAETLTDYIRERLPGFASADVVNLERLPGGYSKATYLVAVRRPAVPEEGWILRCDLPFTPLDTCVRDEFELLRCLFKQGLPVPEPLWCEFDGRLGAPLVAVRQVIGSSDITQWSSSSTQSQEMVREAARLLAAIHQVDVDSLPPLQTFAPGSQGATPAAVLEHVYDFWRAYRIEPDPMVELVFNWLRQNTPGGASRRLVHGDYGLHNLLVDGHRISAVLDWEFAHLGDPREDLAYAKPFVEKVLPWGEFLREYQLAGGVTSDDATTRFYTVLGYLRNSLGCKKVMHAVRYNDPTIDAKFVYVGRSYAQSILRNTAQMTGMSGAAAASSAVS